MRLGGREPALFQTLEKDSLFTIKVAKVFIDRWSPAVVWLLLENQLLKRLWIHALIIPCWTDSILQLNNFSIISKAHIKFQQTCIYEDLR
jgi:hypothetical protein